MNRLSWMLSIALLACLPHLAAAEELTPQKRADIVRLLEMTGAADLGLQMSNATVTQLTQSLKQSRPDIPERVFQVLPQEVNAIIQENLPAFIDMVIPIYNKHFTGSEIKEMLRFYSSDLGKKTTRVMPMLMQESMAAGQKWGQSLGPVIRDRVTERLKREGVQNL